MSEEIINIIIDNIKFPTTKEKFKKIKDSFSGYLTIEKFVNTDYGGNEVKQEKGCYLYNDTVEETAELIEKLDPKGQYVVFQDWREYDPIRHNEAKGKNKEQGHPAAIYTKSLEIYFVNCECPDNLKEYYASSHFLWDEDCTLVKADSDYFKALINYEGFDYGPEIDGSVEIYRLSDWDIAMHEQLKGHLGPVKEDNASIEDRIKANEELLELSKDAKKLSLRELKDKWNNKVFQNESQEWRDEFFMELNKGANSTLT